VLVSFCYVLLRWLLEFVTLYARSKDFKELEIIVLRHELAILRRTARRPSTTAVDRMFLAGRAACCPVRIGDPSSSRRRPCCAGIDA
jgi:hypothetical protein